MSYFNSMQIAREERCSSHGHMEDDPQEVMNLRVLRDWVVKTSIEMSNVGRMAKAMLVELEKGERFTQEAYPGDKQEAAIKAAIVFAKAALDASGYASLPGDIFVEEEETNTYRQMLRATSIIDRAIWDLGGEV